MVSKDEMKYIKEAIVDLSNRTRRNNIVIHNVAEGQENDDIFTYVKEFVSNTVGVKDVEIEAAHRTPTSRLKQNADNPHPRIIHAKILKRSDRDEILKKSPKVLKNVEVGSGKKIFITDDIHPETRKLHKRLVPIMKDMRKKGWMAFIPWTVPRVIRYKDTPKGVKSRLKTFRLEDEITVHTE